MRIQLTPFQKEQEIIRAKKRENLRLGREKLEQMRMKKKELQLSKNVSATEEKELGVAAIPLTTFPQNTNEGGEEEVQFRPSDEGVLLSIAKSLLVGAVEAGASLLTGLLLGVAVSHATKWYRVGSASFHNGRYYGSDGRVYNSAYEEIFSDEISDIDETDEDIPGDSGKEEENCRKNY